MAYVGKRLVPQPKSLFKDYLNLTKGTSNKSEIGRSASLTCFYSQQYYGLLIIMEMIVRPPEASFVHGSFNIATEKTSGQLEVIKPD